MSQIIIGNATKPLNTYYMTIFIYYTENEHAILIMRTMNFFMHIDSHICDPKYKCTNYKYEIVYNLRSMLPKNIQ